MGKGSYKNREIYNRIKFSRGPILKRSIYKEEREGIRKEGRKETEGVYTKTDSNTRTVTVSIFKP